jgi:DNA helicase II / ATP-dependent DNA helicase PcrA
VTLVICEDRQRILDADGHVLVTGGPGCGKTTIALRKALVRIHSTLEAGQKVLFLSFSRAAVARIVETARKDLPSDARRLLEIQTFHSFCWALVRGHGYLLGAPRRLQLMLPHDERSRRNGATNDDPDWDAERERLFKEDGFIAFDLFASKALELLQRSVAIRTLIASRYPLVIVDEAQDTGTHQWACIAALEKLVQLVCLADLDQQIYDFRKDVSPERLAEIMAVLKPLQVDLGTENNRSPGVEIVKFGNDILSGVPRGQPYKGVYQVSFQPRTATRDRAIRQAVGIVSNLIQRRIGHQPESIGYLTNWGKGVAIVARALQGQDGQREIPHRVIMDEAEVLLATRVVALCLEPIADVWVCLGSALDLLADLYRARGDVPKADQLRRNAIDARAQKLPGRARAPRALKGILDATLEDGFSGNPAADWLSVRHRLAESGIAELKLVASLVIYLMAFHRGRRISDALADTWLRTSSYVGARQEIEKAITEDQIIGSDNNLSGINVMTMHKSKGKEFDGVVVLHLGNISPLCPAREPSPYTKSRKLLRVAVTRARHQVLMLTDAFSPCVLLKGHKLT